MENTNQCKQQNAEAQIQSLIDCINALPMISPNTRVELTAFLTELLPSVEERNRERIHNLINVKRDELICRIDADSSLPHNLKEHRKNGVRLYADAVKWGLDGMLFV